MAMYSGCIPSCPPIALRKRRVLSMRWVYNRTISGIVAAAACVDPDQHQCLTVQALVTENCQHIYHAAMMDPHTAAERDLDQIWSLVDDLIATHHDGLPT